MTVGYHLNVEILVKRVIEIEIDQLTESNVRPLSQDDVKDELMTLDDEAFEANFAHGFVAIVLMCTYVEATLNSIIRENDAARRPYGPESNETVREDRLRSSLRGSIEDKIKKVLGVRFAAGTKECANWDVFRYILDARNSLIHYKNNYVQDAIVPDPRSWAIAKNASMIPELGNVVKQHSFGLIFTRSKVNEFWEATQGLVDFLVEQAGCMYTPGAGPVQSDGKDGFASYVVNRRLYEETYSNTGDLGI